MRAPRLRHVAARWSLVHYPTQATEWSLDRKLAAAKTAGFDAVAHPPAPNLREVVERHGLSLLGFVSSGDAKEFGALLRANRDCGAHHINVQLADDDTPTEAALSLTLELMAQSRGLGVEPAIEVHRDTCTETPEKTYALADAYEKATGELLPMTWDFSHPAVIKHLAPRDYISRLLLRPDLIQRAQQFHFRPFNGHHCQIPVTDGHGNLTSELRDWLPFAKAVLQCWWEGNRSSDREIFVCPEMGPVLGGYNLSVLPNSWEEAVVLRGEIDRLWQSVASC